MNNSKSFSSAWLFRLKAAGIHFAASLAVGILTAMLIFGAWYPGAYRLMSGGQPLFFMLISIDVILGPGLTFIAFAKHKSRRHLAMDLAAIILFQLSGLSYGIYTVYQARPLAIVYEVDRFRVISRVDLKEDELPQAPTGFQTFSFSGPQIYGTRVSASKEELFNSIDLALRGFDTGTRPSYWQPYQKSIQSVLAHAHPLAMLYKQHPASVPDFDKVVNKTGRKVEDVKFLPVVAREPDWSALIDAKTGDLIGFLHCDGFV